MDWKSDFMFRMLVIQSLICVLKFNSCFHDKVIQIVVGTGEHWRIQIMKMNLISFVASRRKNVIEFSNYRSCIVLASFNTFSWKRIKLSIFKFANLHLRPVPTFIKLSAVKNPCKMCWKRRFNRIKNHQLLFFSRVKNDAARKNKEKDFFFPLCVFSPLLKNERQGIRKNNNPEKISCFCWC